jgi:hypothetical protein
MPPDREKMDRMLLKDLAQQSHLVADSMRNAPPTGSPVELDTIFGPATVHVDSEGADVVLHNRDVTIHVRRES